jgi:hypothetical protein
MAALVPPPKRHVTVYSGVLASDSQWRRFIIPKPEARNPTPENAELSEMPSEPIPGHAVKAEKNPKAGFSKYIPWHELLRRFTATDCIGEEGGNDTNCTLGHAFAHGSAEGCETQAAGYRTGGIRVEQRG